jgi:hypothetical protein
MGLGRAQRPEIMILVPRTEPPDSNADQLPIDAVSVQVTALTEIPISISEVLARLSQFAGLDRPTWFVCYRPRDCESILRVDAIDVVGAVVAQSESRDPFEQ